MKTGLLVSFIYMLLVSNQLIFGRTNKDVAKISIINTPEFINDMVMMLRNKAIQNINRENNVLYKKLVKETSADQKLNKKEHISRHKDLAWRKINMHRFFFGKLISRC